MIDVGNPGGPLRDDDPRSQQSDAPDLRKPTFLETMLLVVLAQQDCICARLRVEPVELQQAVVTKFAQAGVEIPEGLVIA